MASKYTAGVASLVLAIDRQDIISLNTIVRDDQKNLKVWVSKTNNFTPDSGNLLWDAEGLQATITNLEVEKTHYFRYALTSALDPTIFTISSQYSFIPKANITAIATDLPPNPLGISVSAAISTIIVTLPSSTVSGVSQSTDYNYSDYAAGTLRTNASSTHKSTVVYGIKANSLLQAVAFSAVQDSVLGEFEDKKIFTLPAEAGTIYALFFKYRNKAGRLSAGAEGPFMCETGLDMQKFLDMMANQITEGQLYKGLQSRISSVDRGEKRVAVEVSQLSDQYTVKIDNAGHVAGFGLSNTSSLTGPNGLTLSDGSPFSEFGVVADRFWVAAPAVVGSTAPTENWHGRVWVDTSGIGLNEGLIGGVTVVYNTYSPSIHNPITYASDSTYHYWELKTKTQLDKLQVDIGGYTNRGAWSATATYALKDYVYDLDSNVYYVCIKAYTPSTITNLATKNADKVGNFTATGTFAVDKTLYITGTETILTQANGGGKDSALKLGASYKSSGTFYYITSVSGSVFVLSLTRGGKPISTGIKSTTKYWSETKDPLGVVTGGEWISVPKSDMFPFIVNTTARTRLDTTGNPSVTIPPGVYINNAFIEDASITNAKIANAAIDSAKISELTASKIKGGTIDADLINAGALTVGKLDLQSLRNNINITWALAMPRLSTTAVERTVTLAKGIYEIIIYSSFYKEDTFSTSDGAVTEQATIVAEVSGIGGATCTGYGQWAKEVDSTKFEGKLTSKAGTVNSGSITISNVSGSGYIGDSGGSWSFSVTPTASGGTTTLTNDKVDGVAGKSQTVRLNTALTQVNRAQFNVTTAGDYTFRLNSPTLPSGTWLHAGTLSLLNYLSSAGAATHTLTIASSVNEGATLTGTLATTNIDAGTGYQWKIIHTGTVSNNSHYEEIAGGLTIGSNGSGTFSIKPINDKTTNPAGQAKTFTVEISKAGVGVVATSGTITVNDTSLGPTYSLAFSPGTINETDNSTTTGTVTATANAPTDGTLLYWVIKPSAGYVDNPAKYFSPTSGTITINSGSGTFTIKALEDNETTASKSFQIEVTNDIGSTITFASNPTVTVTDSSQTPGTGGSVSLSGIGNYFVTSPSASVSAGATVYFYPDGTWQAKESTGTTSSGNWFTPTTPGIGSKYWINVTSTSVTNSGGGGSHSSNLGWTQLGAMQNFYAEATGYRCVDPMTPILVDVEGTTVLAKDLQVGMQVYTMHEYTKYWDMFNIVAIQQTTKPKALVTFSDNTTLLVSTSHKFYIGNRQWKQLFDLVPGDFVASRRNGMKQITSIEDQGTGEVISIEVEDAHTYVANDMISHNIKLREASMYSAEYERAFTVQIADNASGTSATSQVVNIGGQVGTPL